MRFVNLFFVILSVSEESNLDPSAGFVKTFCLTPKYFLQTVGLTPSDRVTL